MKLGDQTDLMKTFVVYGSITEAKTLAQIYDIAKGKIIDLIVCNFAIHYIMGNIKIFAQMC